MGDGNDTFKIRGSMIDLHSDYGDNSFALTTAKVDMGTGMTLLKLKARSRAMVMLGAITLTISILVVGMM